MAQKEQPGIQTLIDVFSNSVNVFLNPMLKDDVSISGEMVQMSKDLLTHYVDDHENCFKDIEPRKLLTALAKLLKIEQDEKETKFLFSLIATVMNQSPNSLEVAIDDGLVLQIINKLKKHSAEIKSWESNVLNEFVFQAEGIETTKLLEMGILTVAVNLLENDSQECWNHGITMLVNIVNEKESQDDEKEHPLSKELFDLQADTLLMKLYHNEEADDSNKEDIALCVGAIYQGKEIKREMYPAVETLKRMVADAEDGTDRIKAMRRLRYLALVEANHSVVLNGDFLVVAKKVYMTTSNEFLISHSLHFLLNLLHEGTLATIDKVKSFIVPKRMIELTSHLDQHICEIATELCAICGIPTEK
ncbi:uncharacterized protein MONOS_5984 [Monocercomonoides exilis]|uniref:uncharacterized protein n=1 Tax=Monocercomonoides exilis TaxID=2049356 RepID=UPI00355A1B84|nr:hypothetical protein MONOS_5984 [Monocercomonoides exilis]|eukprot:MONOS_5984.1-p1 / transcript=MONOS_5984.1 / gene=MONOS_5984 / organism=Monocercomonoides_exilis_PA203 / gene_product=unspecified product / transcript_product=unspecified product / location=Mono_scaffold00182:19601-21100(+) / protein_length=361 / sequence_SO=supercontig / SO=protein_coding / is_pseudo=false